MPDLKLKCKDCKAEFNFTEGEQSYYRDRGLAIPKRCARCRLQRRQGAGGRVSMEVPEPKAKPETPPEPKK